ncbi:LysR family transcriptional regulator [Enterovirga aerilata]|uniref:LysR family transcriptional regulator n=1 Tax=Enterovirga aerilata TaxID=2730920 RepID=A0A849I497_9HYPH|nr:LysR family transcriptional regulator [Enterovirga sp. DB1703]NNM70960.1 LysR family transcriptional regulator [Enterovirga sp. DB1703]
MAGSLQDIRLFVAAYEERSFTAAAQRENATQSGVSQHIRKLEERFRLSLFSRDKGRVCPTPAGDSYYRACLDVLRAHDAATKAVQGFVGGLEGELVVGLMPTMTRCVLAPALARFTEAHPNAAIRVVEGYSAALTQHVQAAELDFAIVPGTAGIAGVKSRLFTRTPEVLVASVRHAGRRNGEPVRTRELGPLRLVVPSRANTRRLSIESYFASNGIAIERLLELDAMLGTLDLVGRSEWVAVLPGIMMAADPEPGMHVINPLADPPLTLDLVLIEPARRILSPLASAFLGLLQEEAARVNARWDVPRPG